MGMKEAYEKKLRVALFAVLMFAILPAITFAQPLCPEFT